MKFLARCVLSDKKLYGKCLYWLNILHWNFFTSSWKRVCREIVHCIEYIFYHSGFFSNLRFPWKTECACPELTVLNICFLSFSILSSLLLPWNTECALNSLYWIYIFLSFRIFEQLALALKNKVCPELTVLNIYFLSFRIFEQLALAFKNRVDLKSFTVLKYFYHSGFLSNLRLHWGTEFALNWLYWIYIFIIQYFWATYTCPENRVWHELTVLNIYFYHSVFLSKLCLPWKP